MGKAFIFFVALSSSANASMLPPKRPSFQLLRCGPYQSPKLPKLTITKNGITLHVASDKISLEFPDGRKIPANNFDGKDFVCAAIMENGRSVSVATARGVTLYEFTKTGPLVQSHRNYFDKATRHCEIIETMQASASDNVRSSANTNIVQFNFVSNEDGRTISFFLVREE